MTPPQVFWLVYAGASALMLGATRLILYGLKLARRPIIRILLAHLLALALLTVIAGTDMPFLAGWTRWGYSLALLGFGTAPWLIMDLVRLRVRRGH
jgi:hypothetical protein